MTLPRGNSVASASVNVPSPQPRSAQVIPSMRESAMSAAASSTVIG